MNSKLKLFSFVFSGTIWIIIVIWLCSCTDRYAGMVAARECGQSRYLTIERNGKLDSIAVIPCNGTWRWYHPSVGSLNTNISIDKEPPRCVWLFDGFGKVSGNVTWKKVNNIPKKANLERACVPLAIIKQRKEGGFIKEIPVYKINNHTYSHAYVIQGKHN